MNKYWQIGKYTICEILDEDADEAPFYLSLYMKDL